MGGYDNGDIAAAIVIDSISTYLSKASQLNEDAIHKAIKTANVALRQYQDQHHSKLGSTLGGIIISGKSAITFWVGDVKILHYSKEKLCFESTPHNLTNELTGIKDLNKKRSTSKYDHIVTRSVQGDMEKSLPSYHELQLKVGDKLFICSDGVYNIIDPQTLQYLLKKVNSADSLLKIIDQRLMQEANDNASLIFISYNV